MPSRKSNIKKTRQTRLNWLIVGLMLAAITVLSFPSYEYFDISMLSVGEDSPRTYQVSDELQVFDEYLTERNIQSELRKIKPVFVKDVSVRDNILDSVRTDISKIQSDSGTLEAMGDADTTAEWNKIRRTAIQITEFLIDRGIIESRTVFDQFDEQNEVVLRRQDPDRRISSTTLKLSEFENTIISKKEVPVRTEGILDKLYREFEYKSFVRNVVVQNISPTVFFQRDQFQEKVTQAKSSENWVYQNFSPEDVILRTGEEVTPHHLSLLKKINQQEIRFQLVKGLASLGIAILGLIFVYLYLRQFNPSILESSNKLALICLIVVVLTAITKLVDLLSVELPPHAEYVIPFAAPIMLVSIMIGPELAFVLSIFLGFLTVSFFHFTFELFAMFLLGSFVGIFSIIRVERRSILIQSGLILGGVQVLTVALFTILRTGEMLTAELGSKLFWAGVNGVVFVPPLVIGLLPFLENMFKITTNFKLLELADLNHPLLREMFERAPGSFQHSIMLSNLCERAAREIGANAMLVRVGAYYHDLGKAEIPEYFIENQGEQDNPHDELKPTLSASILKSHVKKGAERAREAGLPREIIDMIEQHHGTTTMQFFYHRALEEGGEDVSEDEFQYPGPRPQTREAGICMLGDAVEATSRTLENPTPNSIREMVEEIVYDKFKDGQLNECDLTLKDLDVIVETFTRVITSVHHQRIEYPDEIDTEEIEDLREMDLPEPDNLDLDDENDRGSEE